jgi:hypothetical protein
MTNRNGKPASAGPTTISCAIYTRKSTDEGLEKEFNSLDAQRESAEAYIASQRHEGWSCLPDRDGHDKRKQHPKNDENNDDRDYSYNVKASGRRPRAGPRQHGRGRSRRTGLTFPPRPPGRDWKRRVMIHRFFIPATHARAPL